MPSRPKRNFIAQGNLSLSFAYDNKRCESWIISFRDYVASHNSTPQCDFRWRAGVTRQNVAALSLASFIQTVDAVLLLVPMCKNFTSHYTPGALAQMASTRGTIGPITNRLCKMGYWFLQWATWGNEETPNPKHPLQEKDHVCGKS